MTDENTFFKAEDFQNQGAIAPNLAEAKCLADIANAKRDKEMEELITENHRLVDTAKAFQKLIVDLQPAMEEARKLMYAKVFSGRGTIEFRESNSVSFVQIEILMAEWLKKYGAR